MEIKNKEKGFQEYIVVRYSGIHGKGIFTSVDIPENELVMPVEGEIISPKECERREKEENNVYIFWNDHHFIDTANTEKIKFINHSCNPNCIVGEAEDNSLRLVSCRPIQKDEEITIDYGYEEIYQNCLCSVCSGL